MTQSNWNSKPTNSEWNSAENWSPSGVPTDTATFASSTETAITFAQTSEASIEIIQFTDNASSYTFSLGTSDTPALIISGEGVFNASRNRQSFIVAATSSGYKNPQLKFINSASAGEADVYYCSGPESEKGYGGGIISFCDNTSAGAAIFKVWTGAGVPPQHSTVGGEVSFSDSSSASAAQFTIYGTLGADGDTFGNVVFHNTATAANAVFTNVGGTVSGGDGGNTQFYGDSTAANGIYNNWGGTCPKANGGDVAFDANATGANGYFHNYAAKAEGAYGGVTSFNNNPPHMPSKGASAGNGSYFNYGAREGEKGGGGHVEFSAKYGSATAETATIVNYGSTVQSKSSAGHTIFSINQPTDYYPSAGKATFWNHSGVVEGTAAGFTEFSVYGTQVKAGSESETSQVPTADQATFINLGADSPKAKGGYTLFSGNTTAANATLIGYGGSQGGYGGRVVFYDQATGDKAKVQLFGNAELDISYHTSGVTIGSLELSEGIIVVQLGTLVTKLSLSGELTLKSPYTTFSFYYNAKGGFELNTPYTVLTCANMSSFTSEQFSANTIEGIEPTFSIVGSDLQVIYKQK
ncbi:MULTISPECIES: hypothetical protein [unclassified Neptuniibacter]|uniref:hypothetical protein n=1 Tax=unclassified Neptuniibacter TaxID=2630693 RepID=UPI000C49B241|nr:MULTISPECIES: hypothetical protein [unclassified Neptuniibacter]MAY42858.1 hypothetical protein [Oceanospirillaceae bacterium]|tara:strand:- start:8506 stop:10248 length:1743 start_codon:yes stop_codon:yes gene_type:complete